VLSYREKQIFFQQLAQLIRSGIALPLAAEKLTRTSSARIRKTSKRLHRLLEKNELTAAEAFDSLRPELEPLERSTLSALARAGRLDLGLQRLADYFGVLARTRAEMIRASAYPVVMLHLGVLLLNVERALPPAGSVAAYVRATATVFFFFYGVGALVALIVSFLHGIGSWSPGADSLLREIPFFGKARRALAVSRFCGTLDLQLDAAVNVIDALKTAADASGSGLIYQMARRGVKRLRKGEPLGALLSSPRGALPPGAVDEILLAEESGELHRVLPRMQEEYEREGLQRLKTAADWLPRLLYLAVLAYLGWRIVSFYAGYLNNIKRQIDAM
jgi:type II secretory pathway component PulF